MHKLINTLKDGAIGKTTTKAILIGGITSQLLTSCSNSGKKSSKDLMQELNNLPKPVILLDASVYTGKNDFVDHDAYSILIQDGENKLHQYNTEEYKLHQYNTEEYSNDVIQPYYHSYGYGINDDKKADTLIVK